MKNYKVGREYPRAGALIGLQCIPGCILGGGEGGITTDKQILKKTTGDM